VRRQIWLAAAGAAALALAWESGVPGLVDPDGFSHLAYARKLVESGFTLRGHPFLPFTILGQSDVDLWLGFHWLLVPFTALSDLWGARIAGACIAGCAAAGLAFALLRSGRSAGAWAFALAPWAISEVFAIRGCNARPSHLTMPLLLAELLAGCGVLHPGWALGAAFAHGLLHLSSPLSPIFALLGLAGARLARERGSDRAVLWSVGGLALALVLRPDRDLYAAFAALTSVTALSARLPHTGAELMFGGPRLLLHETWPGLLLLALSLWLSRRERWTSPVRLAALLGAGASMALCLSSVRFVDYAVPFLVLAAGLFWPTAPLPRWAGAALTAAFAALLLPRVPGLGKQPGSAIDGPETFAPIAEAVRARVPKGELLFTDDPFVTEVLLSVLPEYQYIVAYDPALLWLASPERFWQWHHAATEAIDCSARQCPPQRPSGAAVAKVLRDFGTRWAITSMPRGRRSMQEVMAHDEKRFVFVTLSPGRVYGLYFFELR
jgi:hypothetical protein